MCDKQCEGGLPETKAVKVPERTMQPGGMNMTPGLMAALVAVQAEIVQPVKNRVNPHHGNKYADLSAVIDAIKSVTAGHGIGYTQPINPDEQGVMHLDTFVFHAESGGYISSHYPMSPSRAGEQAQGSSITYLRRYSLQALLGVVGDEDDDGNAAEMGQPSDARGQGGRGRGGQNGSGARSGGSGKPANQPTQASSPAGSSGATAASGGGDGEYQPTPFIQKIVTRINNAKDIAALQKVGDWIKDQAERKGPNGEPGFKEVEHTYLKMAYKARLTALPSPQAAAS